MNRVASLGIRPDLPSLVIPSQISSRLQSSDPALVIVPDVWHTRQHYAPLVNSLRKRGVPAVVVDLFSNRCQPNEDPGDAMYRDALDVIDVVKRIIEQGQDVVLFLHGYGAVPGCEAVAMIKEFGIGRHLAGGSTGKVLRMLFFSAYIVDLGETLVRDIQTLRDWGMRVEKQLVVTAMPEPSRLDGDDGDGGDAPASVALSAFTQPTCFVGWRDYGIPATWIRCDDGSVQAGLVDDTGIQTLCDGGVEVNVETVLTGPDAIRTSPGPIVALLGMIVEECNVGPTPVALHGVRLGVLESAVDVTSYELR